MIFLYGSLAYEMRIFFGTLNEDGIRITEIKDSIMKESRENE